MNPPRVTLPLRVVSRPASWLIPRLTSKRGLVALGLAVVLAVVGAGYLATVQPPRSPSTSNTAFLDSKATSALLSATGPLVETVFSVRPQGGAERDRVLDTRLTPQAREQLEELYAAYLSDDVRAVTLRTTTLGVGVVRMSGDAAEVLVVVEQVASAADGRTNKGTAQMLLQMRQREGTWSIAGISPS